MQLLNRVSLIGRLATEPMVASPNRHEEIMVFRLNTDSFDSTKPEVSSPKHHLVSVEDPLLVCYAQTYLQQGDLVFVEGKLDYIFLGDTKEVCIVVEQGQGFLHPLMVGQRYNPASREHEIGL